MPGKVKALKNQIINIGKKLYDLRLVSGRAGNLSARLDKNHILITASGTCLGKLKDRDIIKVDLIKELPKNKSVSSEFPLHRLIYKNFPVRTVIHCHPPLTNAYFSLYNRLMPLTLETKYYLKEIRSVKQKTLTVTRPELVIEALKRNNLAVLKHHGVVSIANKFADGLYLIELLEEAVKSFAVARLLQETPLDVLEKELKKNLSR